MKRKSWTEPNWVGTPCRDRYPLLFTPQSCHYCIIDQCLLHSLWMNPCLSIVMVCENGIFFFFWVKLLFYRPCSPHSELWLVAASLRETQQLRKQQEPQEKNKTTTNKQTLFQLSEPDPWQSHFLASKDCLQSTLICTCGYFDDHLIYIFFLVFLFFSFFLMVCKSI